MPILTDNPDVLPAKNEIVIPAQPEIDYPIIWIVDCRVTQYDPNDTIKVQVLYKKAREILDEQGNHLKYELSPLSNTIGLGINDLEDTLSKLSSDAEMIFEGAIKVLIDIGKSKGLV